MDYAVGAAFGAVSASRQIEQLLSFSTLEDSYGEKMKKCFLVLMTVFIALGTRAQAAETVPLKLIQTITLPAAIKGHFDHFEVDLKGNRLFATPEGYKSVLVFDLKTGKLIHTIGGIEKSHAVLYREDLDRIYVTDGEAGDVKIFDGKTYKLLSSVKLLEDADSMGYDPVTKYLYVDNGGGDVHQTYSMVSVVDTTAGKKVADIKVDGETLEAMALEKSSPKIYVNNKAKNQVDVIDREKDEVTTSWPVTKCKPNVAIGLDEADHRLFVACRDGQISVLDTESGKEITTLPITKGVDDMKYDAASKRIYAAGDGSVDVYEQTDPDNYKLLGKVPTGPLGKTARLVPELNRYFVAVPQHETTSAKILVFEVH
jgi:DNA-binding beta-propeller fold protein YncE